MNGLTTAMAAVLCIAMLGAAFVSISVKGDKSLPIAILAAGLVGLFASVLFLILAAPDVAMTEAAIGSGLTTFLFFFVLARVRGNTKAAGENDRREYD
jgi:energy-converting hydrogenase B subunit D